MIARWLVYAGSDAYPSLLSEGCISVFRCLGLIISQNVEDHDQKLCASFREHLAWHSRGGRVQSAAIGSLPLLAESEAVWPAYVHAQRNIHNAVFIVDLAVASTIVLDTIAPF